MSEWTKFLNPSDLYFVHVYLYKQTQTKFWLMFMWLLQTELESPLENFCKPLQFTQRTDREAYLSLTSYLNQTSLCSAMLRMLTTWHCPHSPATRHCCSTHTHPFYVPLSGTTRVSWYQKGKHQSGFYWSKR